MSVPTENRTVFLDGIGKPLSIRITKIPVPGSDEVLIRSKALAINPVDYKIQDHSILATRFPFVLGRDIAGEAVAVGENVHSVKPGARVLAHSQSFVSQRVEAGGFQEYVVVPEKAVAPIPATMAVEDAAVLPLAISTASAALFTAAGLNLSLPSHNPTTNGKVVLIWGGASSVGSMGIQLAVAAGFDVYTTCSKRNFAFVQSLGAKKAFDYNSSGVVEKLAADLQKAGQVVGVYDSISLKETQLQAAQVMANIGGGKIVTVLDAIDPAPDTVTVMRVSVGFIFIPPLESVGRSIYKKFLRKALEMGQIKPKPDPEVVGHGLEGLDTAVGKLRAGVSAKKLVVTI